jgi:hypothetical protein
MRLKYPAEDSQPMAFSFWGDDEPKRRTPPTVLRRLVWDRDQGICQICHRRAEPDDWQLAHNRAVVRGGKLTLKNTFVAHPLCNRSMATKTRAELSKTLGIESPARKSREVLDKLSMAELKVLAKKHSVKVKGRTEEGLWFREKKPPTKRQYVNALAKALSADDVKNQLALI